MKTLIVNADDCNLTPQVTHAILTAHERGIVTSTTVLINLPFLPSDIQTLRRTKSLGLGLHLNVTLGQPLCAPRRIPTLIKGNRFLRPNDYKDQLPKTLHLFREYERQILEFKKIFSRLPTHLDTHHQMHDHPFFYRVLCRLARLYHLPIRRSKLTLPGERGIQTPDDLLGSLNPKHFWTFSALKNAIDHLREGISEIMCHPGRNDSALQAVSSFTFGRAREMKLFSDPRWKKRLKMHGICLSHYGLCYTA